MIGQKAMEYHADRKQIINNDKNKDKRVIIKSKSNSKCNNNRNYIGKNDNYTGDTNKLSGII